MDRLRASTSEGSMAASCLPSPFCVPTMTLTPTATVKICASVSISQESIQPPRAHPCYQDQPVIRVALLRDAPFRYQPERSEYRRKAHDDQAHDEHDRAPIAGRHWRVHCCPCDVYSLGLRKAHHRAITMGDGGERTRGIMYKGSTTKVTGSSGTRTARMQLRQASEPSQRCGARARGMRRRTTRAWDGGTRLAARARDSRTNLPVWSKRVVLGPAGCSGILDGVETPATV